MLFVRIAFALTLLTAPVSAQTMLRAQALQEDFTVLRQAYETLHPGLYQYVSKADMDRNFETCRQALNRDQPLSEAYLNVAKLTAAIRCGHSQANFWNQDEATQHALFDQKNCLPLYVKVIDQQLLVTHSADDAVAARTEIRMINGVATRDVLAKLLPYVRADGSNDGKRRELLAITGQKYEYFDIFYPLLFSRREATFDLELYNFQTRTTRHVSISPVTRQERAARMTKKYPDALKPMAELAWLNQQTAILRINSMFDWNTKFDLTGFIENAFGEINQKRARNLIIDIRQLEGGNDKYGRQVVEHLTTKPITVKHLQNTWAYTSIDSSFNQYITNGSWSNDWKYRPATDFTRTSRGQFRSKDADQPAVWQPAAEPFRGITYLLTSPVNSSAGFLLAEVIKNHRLATLVGQTTGGNQKGITAGALFFVRLPNSGIEVDVPLIGTGYDVADQLPDAGISPDVYVEPSVEATAQGIDSDLKMVEKLLRKSN